jgi:iron complex outermembrane receptor protein
LFRITQPSTVLAGDVVKEEGEQRNQGVELSWYGQIVEGLNVLGGVTLLDAENRRGDIPANDGKDVIGVADLQANVGMEWSVWRDLSLDGRVVYTSSQYANAENTIELPSWTRLDLGGRYDLQVGERQVTMRLRVDNVTDKNFWASVGGASGANYLVLAAPRTYTLSVSLDF